MMFVITVAIAVLWHLLQVSGCASLDQIIESLKRYSTRNKFMNEALSNLFTLLKDELATEADPDELLQLVCDAMRYDRHNFKRQLAGRWLLTDCAFNI